MKPRFRIAAALGALALAGGIGLASPAHAAVNGPPPPLTQRYLLSNDTNGDLHNCMDAYEFPATGLLVGVSGACPASGGWFSNWYFDLRGSQYELHPGYYNGDCLTLGTGAKDGQVSIQTCVSGTVPNQLFQDVNVDGGARDYVIFNVSQHYYLNDAHVLNASQHDLGLITSCSQASPSGCWWNQS